MRLRAHIANFRKVSLSCGGIIAGVSLYLGCSTANEAGRCTSFEAPKYVAAISDTDGKPWEIVVQPKVADFTCDNKDAQGTITFSAVVLDGQKQAKPAVAIQAVFSGLGDNERRGVDAGIYSNPANGNESEKALQDDVATDACGVATFRFSYVCPDNRKSLGGSLFIQSGPLFSEAIKVTIENTVQDPPVVSNPANPNP
jgi:hypothetical protein